MINYIVILSKTRRGESAGDFDVTLHLTGSPGIEPRNNSGNYTLILTFDRSVTSGSAAIASGAATIGTPTFSGNTATVSLSGVADRQTLVVELDNVSDGSDSTAKVFVALSVLIGDVNQNGAVTIEDVDLIKSNLTSPVNGSTFKCDTNHNGSITSSDVSQTQSLQNQGSSMFPDFAFTGHYYHARSGLYLAPYRAYNPATGRWISRDPIGEKGGLNLYAYVGNNPADRIDPLGLLDEDKCEALRELLRREELYGTYYAAMLSGNTMPWADGTTQPFNPDNRGGQNIQTPRGEIDVDWYVEMTGTGLPGFAPANYLIGKAIWVIGKLIHGEKARNWFPGQDIGEVHAVRAALDGRFSDTFTKAFMDKECPEPCQ